MYPLYKNPNVCGISNMLNTKNKSTKEVMNTNCKTLIESCSSNTSCELHLPSLAGLFIENPPYLVIDYP